MGKKTPSTSRKQIRTSVPAPYVAKAAAPEPMPPAIVPVPVPAPAPAPPPPQLLESPPAPMLPTFDLRAIARVSLGFCEAALTPLPAPSDLVAGDPAAPSPPPGHVPPGDSRSLRLDSQFALVYRHGASVVSRRGMIGQRGVWRVVDYPGPAQASAAYAAECSRLRGQGFADLA